MTNIKQYMAWCEQRISRVTIGEKLHLGLVRAIQGPLTVTFQVRLIHPSKQALQKLLGLGPALAQALQTESVRITDSARGVLIEVPSPLLRTPRATDLVQHTRGLRVPLGMDQWRHPVTVDVQEHGAVYWIGPSRRGKTQAMKSALYCLLATNKDLHSLVLVPVRKRRDWEAFAGVRGCMGIASTPNDVRAALEWVRELLNGDTALTGRYLILVDDLINLQRACGDISDYLDELASMGAGLGFHLWVGTQAAGSKATSGGAAVEANVSARIIYKPATSQQGARSAGQGGLDTAALTSAKGDALWLEHGFATRIATPWVDDGDIVQLPPGQPSTPWVDMRADTSASAAKPDIGPVSSRIHPAVDISSDTRIYPPSHPSQHAHTGATEASAVGDSERGYAVAFPIGAARPLTEQEQAVVHQLACDQRFWHGGNLSIRRLTVHVYGSRNPQREAWVKEALASGPAALNAEASHQIDLETADGRRQWQQLLQSGAINWAATQEQ